jgi:hypothetical protein
MTWPLPVRARMRVSVVVSAAVCLSTSVGVSAGVPGAAARPGQATEMARTALAARRTGRAPKDVSRRARVGVVASRAADAQP